MRSTWSSDRTEYRRTEVAQSQRLVILQRQIQSVMNIYKPSNRIFSMAVSAVLTLAACDSTSIRPDLIPDDIGSIVTQSVQEFKMRPVTSKSGKQQYLLTIAFKKNNAHLRLPDGINIMSRRKRSPNVVIYDDGKGFDSQAGDGIYSGIVPDRCIPAGPAAGDRASKKVEISCSFAFVGPGKECGDFGTCPERVHRSWLWGLIQYDVDIVICFCLIDCEISSN